MGSRAPIGTILVADDDAAQRIGISGLFERLGFSVIEASNAQEAVGKYNIHHDRISLVIMNIAAPRLDGIEAIKKIRSVNPSAKVILGTNYIDQLVSEVSADAFLQNPFNGRDLWEVIPKVLRGERRMKQRTAWA